MWTAQLRARRSVMSQMGFVIPHREWILKAQPTNSAGLAMRYQLTRQINKTAAITGQQPLVTCRTQRIDLHSLYIDSKSAGRLRCIDHESMSAFCIAQLFQISAEAIGKLNVAETDDAGTHIHSVANALRADCPVNR